MASGDEAHGGNVPTLESDEYSRYWRRDGKLLATSEQLAWYRERTGE